MALAVGEFSRLPVVGERVDICYEEGDLAFIRVQDIFTTSKNQFIDTTRMSSSYLTCVLAQSIPNITIEK